MIVQLPADFVPLPSRGKIYNKNSFFYNKDTIEYKAMTPRQEDILLNSSYQKKGTAVSEMILSCLMGVNVDISDLLVGDKNILLMAIRISGYGKMFEPILTCPKCEIQSTIHIDLTTIPIKFLELEPKTKGKNEFTFMLPRAKRNVIFKFLTVKEESEINYINENQSEYIEDTAITTKLLYSIVSIDNIKDKSKIKKFIYNMSAADSNHLRKYIDKHQPGLDLETDFVCETCQYIEKLTIPTNYKFFSMGSEYREKIFLEPFFLLGYYFGIDFETYYNMPMSYRKWLVERIGKEIKSANDTNKDGGSNIPSKGAHHNSPDVRALAGKRPNVPAKLRRF